MNDLLLIIGASEEHGTLTLYKKQLAEAGIDVHIHDGSDKPNIGGGGNLGYRVKIFRELAQRFAHYQFIIFSDGFDVTFWGNKVQVISKIPHAHLLHAAEKNCYPPECADMPIPDRGPWKYANGGLVAGTPQAYLAWCEAVEAHPRYLASALDQWFLNLLVAENSLLCVIDSRTDLFFCLYGGYDELGFVEGSPINGLYGTLPSFLHSNGGWTSDEMFARQKRSLSI